MSAPSVLRAPVSLLVLLHALGAPAPAAAEATPPASATAAPGAPSKPPDRWAPFRGFLGVWEGTSRGQPGDGKLRREYRLVLGDRFIEVRNRSVYPPQEKNPEGEVHEDVLIERQRR